MSEASGAPGPGAVWRFGDAGRAHPWLLALHGFGGSGADFGALAAELNRTLLAPDLPGHGRGPLPDEGPGWELGAAGRSATWRALDLPDRPPGRPALLGYSMGGRAALAVACRDAAPLCALILISASAGLTEPAARAARAQEDQALARHILAVGAETFAKEWAAHPLIQSQQRTPEPWRSQMAARRARARPEGLARSLRGMGQGAMEPLHQAVRGLELPVLLITGAQDTRYGSLARELAGAIPHARHVVIAGAGHAPQLEQPRATAAALSEFLSGLDATASG